MATREMCAARTTKLIQVSAIRAYNGSRDNRYHARLMGVSTLIRENFRAAVLARRAAVRAATRQMNISDSTVHRWETGQTIPPLAMIEQLADAMGIEPLRLLMSESDLVVWDSCRQMLMVAQAKFHPPERKP